MLLKKTGFPEENELVMCTVTAIHYHSVFAKIDEYDKSGMIHISEVSPGRIRNIRDFVKEGKKVVCKVLRISLEKGHIDLSLRRVNEGQRKNKISELKQQQLSEKILENIAKKNKKDVVKLFENVYEKIIKEYDTLFEAFEAVANDKLDLGKLGIDQTIAKDLSDVIKQRIKPAEVSIKGDFTIQSFAPNGLELIQQLLKNALENQEKVTITYKGGGLYQLIVKATGYKEAEQVMSKVTSNAENFAKKNSMTLSFERMET